MPHNPLHPLDDFVQRGLAAQAAVDEAITNAQPWVIWSFEHDAWWAPHERGYVLELAQAGRYTKARALEIEAHANVVRPNELALSLAHAETQGHP